MTQDSISKFTNTDKGTTARSITRLEELGYVKRHVDLDDRRACNVCLTEKGREIEPPIRQKLKKWAELITDGFTPAETKNAYDLIERMALNAIDRKASMNSEEKNREVNKSE